MPETDIITKLLSDQELKITHLRKEVLDIFLSSKKPLSAYEVLNKLKKSRPNAEPPTVYRVIEYFVQKEIIHRIETGNKYVFCSHLENFNAHPQGILFLCEKCGSSYEIIDDDFLKFIKKFSKIHQLSINELLVEMKGICQKCLLE